MRHGIQSLQREHPSKGAWGGVLRVWYGPMEGAVYNTDAFFRNAFQEEWLDDELSRRMVEGVDRAVVESGRLVRSRVLGPISPYDLSGGVKTLLLVRHVPDRVFNASTCGDDCALWLLAMGRERDVTVNLKHMMDFGGGRFSIEVANDGSVAHTMAELVMAAGPILADAAL